MREREKERKRFRFTHRKMWIPVSNFFPERIVYLLLLQEKNSNSFITATLGLWTNKAGEIVTHHGCGEEMVRSYALLVPETKRRVLQTACLVSVLPAWRSPPLVLDKGFCTHKFAQGWCSDTRNRQLEGFLNILHRKTNKQLSLKPEHMILTKTSSKKAAHVYTVTVPAQLASLNPFF